MSNELTIINGGHTITANQGNDQDNEILPLGGPEMETKEDKPHDLQNFADYEEFKGTIEPLGTPDMVETKNSKP